MTESADVVLAYWTEHRDQMRQSENQRALLTNYILIIVAALSGLIVQQQLKFATLPLSILIIVIGLYGSITVAKYHERAEYHLVQARALTRILVTAGALPETRDQLNVARERHNARHPLLHRIRLHMLWTSLHLSVAGYGTLLAVLTLVR